MSIISEKNHLGVSLSALKSVNINMGTIELEARMKALLQDRIHGLSFSPYTEGQTPLAQSQITKQQINDRLSVIQTHTGWVRTFSCTDGNELVPAMAHAMGMKTMVGAWISDDQERNAMEIDGLIAVAKAGHADIVAVGNEVMLRGELSEEDMKAYIVKVKEALPNVKVGYVDAYYIFDEFPGITDVCDVILANCYPFWENCPLPYAVDYMKQMYSKALGAAKGKPVIIAETGWPDKGDIQGDAEPSYDNAMQYFIGTYEWAHSEAIEVVYFSSFDEEWKTHHEGECGASWGLWDKNRQYKFDKNKGE